MKTISLTEEAYQRLLMWKETPRDSFSRVVLRIVPPKYSGAAVLEAAQSLPPLTEEQEMILRETCR
ncbi:MAG: hypothetical protein HN742_17735 [Lentisphaerae bacterium]|jgi:predicted CopG family antitoxin|nr:hypothetical protein [Lentisphaerota bacterium]MBT4819558.1 hypothetical protein [Lentisphaerota bacterium]MBT5611957.1 hypothetical protein [Lentisphaerota bacterium]MBT7062188.1 hypothetical protein [Lentisphaerota bacterium]MBT7843724.1 hypothetical protein [Lentisphaerota bacterium]